MKTHKFILSSFLSLLLIMANVATVTAQTAPAPAAAGGTFEQRLNQRKQERKIQLPAADTKRLTSQCIGAQGKLRSLQNQTRSMFSGRAKLYQSIDGKLWIVIGQLKLAEKDTFSLEKQRGALAEKVGTFQTTAGQYQQVLDDLIVINCQSDVVGFKALLETAKLYHKQLRDQSAGIRTYILNDIKPSLTTFRSDLQSKPTGNQ